jgi:hypothetical protein
MKQQLSPIDIRIAGRNVNYREAVTVRDMDSKFFKARFRGSYDLLLELLPPFNEPQPFAFKWEESITPECDGCPDTVDRSSEMQLSRIVFHHPSEHTVNGTRYPVEVQFFLKASANEPESGAIAVLGITTGRDFVSPDIQDLETEMAEFSPVRSSMSKDFNPAALLPMMGGYFAYEGADTAPPCRHKIKWMVMEHTVNFTEAVIPVLRKHIAQFHPETVGSARPLTWQDAAQVAYHPGSGALMKSGGYELMTTSQRQAHLNNKLMFPSVWKMDTRHAYTRPYGMYLESQCKPKPTSNRSFEVDPNTHPDVLALNPDVVIVRTMPTLSVHPEHVKERKPIAQGGAAVNGRVPRKFFADWTKASADQAVLREKMDRCKENLPMSPAQVAECRFLLSQLPEGSYIFTDVPMPPLPPLPEKKFVPNNWPLEPDQLAAPEDPSEINPYNPWGSLVNKIPRTDPQAGAPLYMQRPKGQATPWLKPLLAKPNVYPSDAHDENVLVAH